jgi:hypothetical protein
MSRSNIFQKLRFSPDYKINFPYLFDNFMHAHLHCILKNFLIGGSHNHFIEIKYMTRGPVGRNGVCFNSPLRFSPYNNNPPSLCFPFVGTYSTSTLDVVPIFL